MANRIRVPQYLFRRLQQYGLDHVHGVPGDFSLRALDYLHGCGLKWIGNCNELNAGYAADGYARIKGLGALMTTYGVGEASAINAVSGSFSEYVPVVHIVGTGARALQRSPPGHLHHSPGDGRLRVFADMFREVTVAQANLFDEEEAPEQIDRTIEKCLTFSQPVYIELPADMANVEVSDERLSVGLKTSLEADEKKEDGLVRMLLEKIYASKQPLLLVDRAQGVPYLKDEINELVKKSGISTLAMPSGNCIVEHAHPNFYGVHSGPVGQIDTMPFVRQCDLVLAFGPMFSDTQTVGWSVVPDPAMTVVLGKNSIGDTAVDTRRVLRKLIAGLDRPQISYGATDLLGDFRTIKPPRTDPFAPITQTSFYQKLNPYFKSDDLILLANATPILGGRDFILPPRAQVISSGMFFSVGHMLPAAQGAALAQGASRTILFDGDGSFQATVQELSTIIWQRLNVTIFIMNNGGYAYERLIHGPNEVYNDIAPWDYLQAPKLFSAPTGYKIETHRIQTWRDLDGLLGKESFHDGQGLKLVEVVVGREDVPEKFRQVFKNAGKLL